MNLVPQQPQCNLSILHFNDVYDIQADNIEPKGGAAYFKTLLDRYRVPSTLTLFSGDSFAPALLSAVFKGQNMVTPLNSFKIDVACVGNHDLDYELEHVKYLKSLTNFPWLLSNVYDNRTHERLADSDEYKIIEKGGFRIGIFSLAEKQWIDTLIPSYKQICEYIPWEEFADYMIKQLKSQKCNMIIALTHMMKYNDVKLAQKFPDIDLILGGHDHLVVHQKVNNSLMIKSGSNFKNFSFIEIYPATAKDNLQKGEPASYQQKYLFSNSNIAIRVTLVEVNHAKTKVEADPQLNAFVLEKYTSFAERQQKIACYFKQDIDLRFKSIRKEQNAYLEFLVSIYRHYTKADCALMNGGNFRADSVIHAGPVTYGLLTNIIQDQIVVKKVPGQRLLAGLENCVSMYPNLSGRYSTFSGIQFTWDPNRKPFERILIKTVRIGGKPLNLQRIYRVAMHGFVSQGGDGFTVFKDCQVDHDHFHENNLMLINDLLMGSEKLLTGYSLKYPGRITYVPDENGHQMLHLSLPNPKNVHMIGQKAEPKNV